MNLLFIDFGSSFIKYSIYDELTGEYISENKIEFPKPIIDDGIHFHVSTKEISDSVFKIIGESEKHDFKKMLISVQMHGYITKKASGEFSDYVSWRDKSGDIKKKNFQNIDINKFGTSFKSNLPLTKIEKFQADKEFFTLGSYLAWILCGKNITHITDACASGFFYAETGEKNEFSERIKMPCVSKSICVIGEHGTAKVYTPFGDHQVSFLGSGANDNAYLLNIGTATQISCIEDENFICKSCEKRPYFYDSKRLFTISGITGGIILYKERENKEFIKQLKAAIKILPKKKKLLVGGGGSAYIYNYLREEMLRSGIKCEYLNKNIGMEGLKMIAETIKIKAGVMLSEVPFGNFPIIVKNSQLDFYIIDNEHGAFDYSVLEDLIVTSNLVKQNTIIRIGDNSRNNITKLADMGAKGFLLPMTNTKSDIKKTVEYAKYPPIGKRGVSTTRAHTFYNPPKLSDYMKTANETMKVYAQIETVSGVQNIEEILSVNGVDGVFIGPNDLSIDFNCIGDKAAICKQIDIISRACKKLNKPWGIITGDKDLTEFSINCGVNMISCGSELNMLTEGCKKVKNMF